ERRPVPPEPFANSIGAFSGPSERVVIEFDASVAAFVRARQWHRSQQIEQRPDGSLVLRLEVSIDPPLKQWILGFGAHARVLAPPALARDVAAALRAASAQYQHASYRPAKTA